jgi:hypothetical protein
MATFAETSDTEFFCAYLKERVDALHRDSSGGTVGPLPVTIVAVTELSFFTVKTAMCVNDVCQSSFMMLF